MYKCHCGKEFENHRARNAHQIAHKDKPTRYSESRKKNQSVYECLYCHSTFEHNRSTENKFCSTACNTKYKWEFISVPKIEQGLGGNCKKYLKEKYGEVCAICGQSSIWNNKPLVLQLDHIDGNSDNDQINNLRLICPNCHTQTDTYGSKGNGNRYKKNTKRNSYLREYKS
jgi:HNH endonuclease